MKKSLVMLLLAAVMVLGLTLGIVPQAEAATVSGTQISLLYDDQKDLEELLGTTVTSVTITNQSVTSKDVAEALQKEHGISLDKRKIEMPEPVKSFGSYKLNVRVYPGIQAKLTLSVKEK